MIAMAYGERPEFGAAFGTVARLAEKMIQQEGERNMLTGQAMIFQGP